MNPQRWPSRRPPTTKRRPPGIKTLEAKTSTPQTKTGAPPSPSIPYRVPPRWSDALLSSVWIVLVLAFLVFFLFYLYSLALPEGAPQLIVYFATLGATVLAVVLFAWSLLVYVLPRLVGLRSRPRGNASGKD